MANVLTESSAFNGPARLQEIVRINSLWNPPVAVFNDKFLNALDKIILVLVRCVVHSCVQTQLEHLKPEVGQVLLKLQVVEIRNDLIYIFGAFAWKDLFDAV